MKNQEVRSQESRGQELGEKVKLPSLSKKIFIK